MYTQIQQQKTYAIKSDDKNQEKTHENHSV